VYVHGPNGWTEEAVLSVADVGCCGLGGMQVAFDSQARRAAVGATRSTAVQVFVREGVTWTEEAVLTISPSLTTDAPAEAIAFSLDTLGQRIIVGTLHGGFTTAAGEGAVVSLLRSGRTWRQELVLLRRTGLHLRRPGSDMFGVATALADNGTVAFVGAPGRFDWRQGTVYRFRLPPP
jgi:hypothetical protein